MEKVQTTTTTTVRTAEVEPQEAMKDVETVVQKTTENVGEKEKEKEKEKDSKGGAVFSLF